MMACYEAPSDGLQRPTPASAPPPADCLGTLAPRATVPRSGTCATLPHRVRSHGPTQKRGGGHSCSRKLGLIDTAAKHISGELHAYVYALNVYALGAPARCTPLPGR